MAFDLASAEPVSQAPTGFDLSSAEPVDMSVAPTKTAPINTNYGNPAGNSFFGQILPGVGKLYTDAALATRQMLAPLTGADPKALDAEAAEKRHYDAPLQSTWGGKAGEVAGALPFAFLPGANTYLGATALGGAAGALQPTVGDESRALNTGVGAGLGLAAKWGGDKLSGWLTSRTAQPFLGWNQSTGNRAFAEAVGSEAPKLDQPAIKDTADRLGGIFNQARSPKVTVQIPPTTSQALSDAEAGLSQSSRAAFWKDPQVNELMTHLQNGTATAKELGTISSRLGNNAAAEMTSKGGDRELAKALFALQDHADDLVGGSIKDPALSAAYDAARPQYRTFLLAKRPTILNSSTGDVNLRNLGNYLQKADFKGFTQGGNTSPLYEAARFGQSSGIGSRPPPPILQPFKFGMYHAINNPVVGAFGGALSRLGAPLAPALPPAARAAALLGPSEMRGLLSQ